MSNVPFCLLFTDKGAFIGAPCEFTCSKKLHHVFCDPTVDRCSCEKLYPVVIGVLKGCAKRKNACNTRQDQLNKLFISFAAKKLGEQCFYDQTCVFNEPNSLCVQVHHNAMCECVDGFHSVVHYKPSKREFCTPGTH